MRAMQITEVAPMRADRPALAAVDMPDPVPQHDEVLIRVGVCGVCHTELDEIEGRTPPPALPVVPGHQVVGRIAEGKRTGERVGVAWVFSACGHCEYCTSGRENLCPEFRATGRDAHGGYAEYLTAPARFVHTIPDAIPDAEAAPLLCAGAVGYRALKLSGLQDGDPLALYGFGASNHLVLKTARSMFPQSSVFVCTRNPAERDLAMELGAAWAGAIGDEPPQPPRAAIDATPAWLPVLAALRSLAPGGRLIINAIRKEEADKRELLTLDFASHLWREKEIKSVANITRQDVREFLGLAAEAGIRPEFQELDMESANRALLDLKEGRIRGAKVLRVS